MLAYLAELRTFYRGAILGAGADAPESVEDARTELKCMIKILREDIDFSLKRVASNA